MPVLDDSPTRTATPAQGEQDLGPLAWVLDEVRKSLEGATKAVGRFVRDTDAARLADLETLDTSALRIARQQLHQACGALEMVGITAPAQVLRSMEAAVNRFAQRPADCTPDAVATLERTHFALMEYLEAVLAGAQVSAVALFPQYRDTQLLAGNDKAHPADLWPAERRAREPRWIGPVPEPLAYGPQARALLDGVVLRMVKSGDREAAAQMRELCLRFAAGQGEDVAARSFWKIAAGFFEGLARGLIAPDIYVKRMASRVLMQYAAMAKGDSLPPARLLQDLMFFCAQAQPREQLGEALQAVHEAYSMAAMPLVDYQVARFGRYDPALLILARKRIAAVAETWSAVAGGDRSKIRPMLDQFGQVAELLVKLQPASHDLARALIRVAETVDRIGEPPPAELAMEVATAVLYLQASFMTSGQDEQAQAAQCSVLVRRLDATLGGAASEPLEPWMEELYRQASDRQTMGSVVGELRATLGEAEKHLDQYFRDPADVAALAAVPGQMAQMRGVLMVLGFDQAATAMQRMRDTVEHLMLGEVLQENLPRIFEKLGSSLGAMGFLIDMLSYQRNMARKLFVYDEDKDELRIVMGQSRARGPEAFRPAMVDIPTDMPDAPQPEAVAIDIAATAAIPPTVTAVFDEKPEIVPKAAPAEPERKDEGLGFALDFDMPAQPAAAEPAEPTPEPSAPEPVALPELTAQEPDGEDELLSIFLEEAREVVGNGLQALQALADEPANLSEQTTLRRAFHTLKGSSRMVGLDEFGEAGWAMEQMLNAWLAEQWPMPEPMQTLARDVLKAFAAWVQDLEAHRADHWSATPFRAAADAMRLNGERAEVALVPRRGERQEPPAAEPAMAEPAAAGQVQELDFAAFEAAMRESEQAQLQTHAEPQEAAPPPAEASAPEPEPEPLPELTLEPMPEPEPEPEPDYKDIDGLRISTPLYNVYLGEADEWSVRLDGALQQWRKTPTAPVPDEAVALAHSLAGSSGTVGFKALSELARLLEHALAHLQLQGRVQQEQIQHSLAASDEIRRLLHQFAAGFLKTPQPAVEDALRAMLDTVIAAEEPPAIEPVAEPAPATAPAVYADGGDDIDAQDQVDPDLFPIFEEEAVELLPRLGAALRRWHGRPALDEARSEALRALHTLKGSARLAGAMRLGEMTHRLESAVERVDPEQPTAEAIEPLLASFDALQAVFDRLRMAGEQAPEPPLAHLDDTLAQAPLHQPAQPADTAALEPQAEQTGPAEEWGEPVAAPAAQRAAPQQTVRVRAQLLDRLISQTGEVLIARSRVDARLTQARGALSDLTGNLERLRAQLRDIEVQAESQMQSRLALSKDTAAGFDPLEFDRFTRVQELTRMMAESVNDVATVQRNLQRELAAAEDDLVAQGRQARDLQRDLLRTRMVEFDSFAERLYAVVRQTSKELGKQVRLNILGGTIEMDRGMLERMMPAFEHLLRNCVAHGIETPAERQARGKPAVGSIEIILSQERNDVALSVEDDGAGLNLERIRAKAVSLKLWPPGQPMDIEDAGRLIFEPGFSTAEQVTGVAGRGIGMDVVRSEVNALGGRIETHSEPGRGSAFRLVLPLTTAVTQVVMLRMGAVSMGVPANLIEIVRRVPVDALEQSYRSQEFHDGSEVMPFYWAGALWQVSARSEENLGRTRPVVIVRSASQRLALHVDEVLGNQEVVIKNLGPQLSRLPGLTGMSVLPSGAVVQIYNPVALATVYGDSVRALQAGAGQAAPQGASADQAAGGQSTVPLVLVVDDSITVRRVTQRLLQREGYRVALAADGLQAMERLQDERPMLVLSDIEMPRMDGFDLLRNIRADQRLEGLPVVMITSRIASKHREMAMALGANHYLGKPYSDEELLGLIQHYALQRSGAAPEESNPPGDSAAI